MDGWMDVGDEWIEGLLDGLIHTHALKHHTSPQFSCRLNKKSLNILTRFLVEGIEDPNTAINGPSSARQRNAI